MNDNEDEHEIKIEYFESYEVDPLRDEKIEYKYTGLFVRSEELKKQKAVFTDSNNDDSELLDNYQDNDTVEPEIIVNWHKQVDQSGKYVCRFCDLSYVTVQTLRHHIRLKHTNNYNNIKSIPIKFRRRNKVKCHICKKTFENTKALQEHSHIHNLHDMQNACMLCQATFKERNDLLYHMTIKHKSLKKLHTCTICGYSTPKVSNFKKHLDIHTGINKIKCSYCIYTTSYQPNMKIHEQIHSKEKPYSCELNNCEYRCKTVSALRSHQLMHNKEKHLLYCDKCSYSTVYKVNLKKHIDTHWRKKLDERNRNDNFNVMGT